MFQGISRHYKKRKRPTLTIFYCYLLYFTVPMHSRERGVGWRYKKKTVTFSRVLRVHKKGFNKFDAVNKKNTRKSFYLFLF